jgi:hypothetical protein
MRLPERVLLVLAVLLALPFLAFVPWTAMDLHPLPECQTRKGLEHRSRVPGPA